MNFFRSSVQNLKAYVPGFQPKESGFIKLNTNENPYPPSPLVLNVLKQDAGPKLRLYPDPLSDKLRDQIAALFKVNRRWVIVGNGSDEVLALAIRAVLGKNDKVFITDPTYTLFEVLAKIQEAKIIRCPLNSNFDFPEKLEIKNMKMVMIANPNAPTGILFSRKKIEEICRRTQGFVLIDEAYVDFAEEHCMNLVKKFKNVIVTRSLSKSFSLAGLRVGFAISRPETIEMMMKLKDSYNVNRLSQEAALVAFKDLKWMKEATKRIIRDREFLSEHLKTLGFTVLPSQANFIFVKHVSRSAIGIFNHLYQRKILVRHFNLPKLKSYLRISIGTHQEMIKLIKTLEEILKLNKK
jgi:histidinol-phosphate aminotransferase